MAKETVLVGCRLPNGITLTHPQNKEVKVTLKGQYGEKSESGLFIPPAPYGMTTVDAGFWNAWKEAYQGYPLLKTRAIFEAKSEAEFKAMARELEMEKTGMEAVPQMAVVDGTRLERLKV